MAGRGLAILLLLIPALAFGQEPFRELLPMEGRDGMTALPPDWQVPGEFVVGRLMFPDGNRSWKRGGTRWAVDYPKGDRTLAALLRRFTRMNVRSVEQPVDPDHPDDLYNWPFLYAGLAGYWQLSEEHVERLREYLLRGGFLYADSFFGDSHWVGFERGLKRIFPDRAIIELSADHPIFHIVYDIPELKTTLLPNMQSLMQGGGGYMNGGRVPHWYGIEDDDGRLMVLIGFNNDTSDAWQWADDPRYPAEAANLGLRIGVNISTYLMTH